jgi:hypothetical protein
MLCPNCGSEHGGEFCNVCGQSNVDLRVPIGGLVREAAEEALGLDSRLRHTLVPFFLKPGAITSDYLSGRRVRYTSPLKMYLVAAALFFFAFTLHPNEGPSFQQDRPKLATGSAGEGRISRYFSERARKLDTMGREEARKQLTANMANMLPKALIVLLPIFALLLKVFWHKRYFAEHLIFALHYHAFALIVLAACGFLSGKAGDAANSVGLVLCFVYLFVALRRVYGGSRLRTFAKLVGLGFTYGIAVSAALAAAGVASLAFL